MDDLTEQEESYLYSNNLDSDNEDEYAKEKSASSKKDLELSKFKGKSDHMFFEFFGMYTKESIKVQKRTGANQRNFNTRSI